MAFGHKHSTPEFDGHPHHYACGNEAPEVVHFGRAEDVLEDRRRVLAAAYAAHPERFVRRAPQPAPLPEAAWINPPANGRRQLEEDRQ